MAYELKKQKMYSTEVVNFHPVMRALTYSFVDSNPRLNYAIMELQLCITYKETFICGKNDSQSLKKSISV